MQLWQYRLLVTARLLYMFRTPSNIGCHCSDNRLWTSLLDIYIIQTHDQWLLLQFLVLLMMDAESVRNM